MNNFIAMIIVLPMLLFFPMQYGLQVKNHYNITQFQNIVAASKEEAKQAGYFTPENINDLREAILNAYKGLSADEIKIQVTTTPKYRKNYFDERELIHYDISIPIKSITAAPGLFGISDAENQMRYSDSGTIASERLPPVVQ